MSVPVTVELFLGGAWVDITSDVRVDAGITISQGVPRENATADPAQCSLTVNNRDGKFSPRNPMSPYFGTLGRNTPLRVSVDSVVRFSGEVSEFPSRWNIPGTDVWTPLVASGILRRLNLGRALQSTLTAGLKGIAATTSNIVGYWPMEDGAGSTSFAPGIPGIGPLRTTSGTPIAAAVDPGVASDPIPTWETAIGVASPRGSSGTGFTAGFYLSVPASGTTDNADLLRVDVGGTANLWVLRYDDANDGQLHLLVKNVVTDTILLSTALPLTAGLNGRSVYIKLEAATSGANVGWYVQPYGAGTGGGATLTTASVGAPTGVSVGSIILGADVGIGQVVLGNTSTALFLADFDAALRGHAGETVTARMNRVADLGDIPIAIAAGSAEAVEMGAQPSGSALGILRVAEAADVGGILRDAIDDVALEYVTRRGRYPDTDNASVTLDYAAGHLSPPLEPTDDDSALANDVTVTRAGGSSARVVLTDGPLNVQPYPDGVGAYPSTPTVGVYSDDQLPDVASWLLHLGTVDEARYPQVTVDLVKNPAIVEDVEAIRPGHPITITNLPGFVSYDDVRLHALGWTETISSHTRTITFNCAPASPWDIGIYDDAGSRYAASAAVLDEDVDEDDTSFDVDGEVWTQDVAHFPFDVMVGGERMTVTAISGSSSPQTFTVTRSVNGVVKTHSAGAPVQIAAVVFYGL